MIETTTAMPTRNEFLLGLTPARTRRATQHGHPATGVTGKGPWCAIVLALLLLALPGRAQAATYVWDFAANASCAAVPGSPVALCDSDYHSSQLVFADTTSSFSITARGYYLGSGTSPTSLVVGTTTWTIAPMSPNSNLWAKFNGNGDDETGLGIADPDAQGNQEIEKNNFIQLDLTGLPVDAEFIELHISSLQDTETATIWGNSSVGQPGRLLASFVGMGGSAQVTFHYDLTSGRYLTVSTNPNQAAPNDVLIQSGFTAVTPTTTTTTSTSSTTTTTTTSSTTTTTTETTTTTTENTTSSTSTTTTTTSTTTPTTNPTTPVCGDGMVDAGEQCDPPGNNSMQCPSSPAGAFLRCNADCTCCVPQPEICGNTSDDDCDGQIDCSDPDCTNLPPCIRRDPSRIRFDVPPAGLDLFTSHGKVNADGTTVTNQVIRWQLTNARGIIYQGTLQPGDLTSNANSRLLRFRDPGARLGQGQHDGIYKAKIQIGARGTISYHLKAYGDLSAATDPDMALHFLIGSGAQTQAWGTSGTWRRTSRGWVAGKAQLLGFLGP